MNLLAKATVLSYALSWALCSSAGLAQEKPQPTTPLTGRLLEVTKTAKFRAVSRNELRQAEDLFAKTFDEARLNKRVRFEVLQTEWKKLGWEFTVLEARGKQDIYVLSESKNRSHGRGFFAFRCRAKLRLAVQAPHCFYDKHTRRIALDLFERESLMAGAWNTVHRKVIDVAHSEDNYINAFTRAFLRTKSRRGIVQVHGFNQSKRKTTAGQRSDIIVSNGTKFPGRMSRAVWQQLTESLPERSVSLYPSDVWELGATTNAQAKIVHRAGRDNFVHIEISGDLRQALRKSQSLRDRLNRCFRLSLPGFAAE